MDRLNAQRDGLLQRLRDYGSCAVAFSGGVDSSVVAQAARLALGDRAAAMTAVSASLADGELSEARRVAQQIGIRHLELSTREFANPAYLQNGPDRCYHCKSALYARMAQAAGPLGLAVLVNGANLDDVGDYRPGMEAARQVGVRSPLIECQLGKRDVRALAQHWELPVWDKPAAPCLSSRVAYGEPVTPERLAMIDQAERFLRSLGAGEVRVRYHAGDVARIEVSPDELARLASGPLRTQLAARLRDLGFKFVTLDLDGFRSGSLNHLLAPEDLVLKPSPDLPLRGS
jgi:uncharacterized protein